jgi:beta-glucosidase
VLTVPPVPRRSPLSVRARSAAGLTAFGLMIPMAAAAAAPGAAATSNSATPNSATSISTATNPAGSATTSSRLPYLDPRLPVERRVRDLLGRMTLPEKVGQMTQAERGNVDADPSLITSLNLGSVLSGGGSVPTPNTPTGWADMVDRFQSYALRTRLGIPLIYGVDAVHGHGNVYGATIFPHNIGLGATRDPGLVERAAHVTATEVRATGIPWSFAPCVCVTRDARWGRSYESFGEEPVGPAQRQ